ncbi:MAG TPA: pyrroline-5-carboxylate reductase [Oscillatoriales cyanobacterium M59_W2019_021]|nr:pyrroline-5-carboxylate reductase [Oscillatoriales cyanobacterium M4454_W2019_049]HIK53416.1 pyrroline-5-carboxylate reductase [Oscillatoriales cyanobacterium M59_W2019_021]
MVDKVESIDRCSLGIVGGGVMAEALLSRLLGAQTYQPTEVLVSEPAPHRRDFLVQTYGVRVTEDNTTVVVAAEVLLLAVKPQVFETIAAEVAQTSMLPSGRSPLVISILAGVPLSKLEAAFPGKPIVRAMPNTPATVGAGITAIAAGSCADGESLSQARRILEAVGDVVEVAESLMDAVTGLSGSGPGYVAVFVEALTDGGVAAGLPRAIASHLAVQTVLGTARLLAESGMHPAELKDRVTSPGGTTISGIAELEKAGARSAIIEAVRAASRRSRELGG